MMLAWWYMHVSSFLLLHICCFRYRIIFIHALHPLIRFIHSCTTLTHALHLFLSFHVLAIYVLYLSMHCYLRCNHLCVTVIHALKLFIYHIHLYVTFVHALYWSHSFMCCTYLCIALIHLLHLFYASHSFNDLSHWFMCFIYSCIALSIHYVTSLFSHIGHAAYSLLTPFFFLIFIKSRTSWGECSATIIKVSKRADVYKIHY